MQFQRRSSVFIADAVGGCNGQREGDCSGDRLFHISIAATYISSDVIIIREKKGVVNKMAVTTKDLFSIEMHLLFSMDPVYVDGWAEGTEDDRMIYKAFSAIQELRKYLEKKEGGTWETGDTLTAAPI